MAEPKIKTESRKRGGWLRKLVWLGGVIVVLLVVFYFVATSAALFKSVILPRVGNAIGADVTVADAQISPFSHVVLHDLKVQPRGGEPLLIVREVRASYSLWSIIGGKIVVQEVAIESPVVTVIENADGSSNLDAFLKAQNKDKMPKSTTATASSKSAQVDIKKIALNNATVRLVKNYKSGARDVTDVTGLNFTVSDLKNGQSGRIELAAALAVEKAAQPSAATGALLAKLIGGFDFALTPDLKPASAKGNTTFTVEKASGALADLDALAAKFDCELTSTELKQLALRFTKADSVLGEVRVGGPFETAKSEGKLKLEILAIDKRALNLIGAASGMDFGTTTISSTNDIEFSKGGSLISTVGRLEAAHFQVTRQSQTSPTLDLRGDYAVTVDQSASAIVLKTLNLTGTQNSRPLLQSELSSPMTIAWGSTSSAVGDATLTLTVTNLDLADWKAFTGDPAPGGIAGVKAKLVSQKAGQQLAFELEAHLDNLATGKGSARVNHGDVRAQVRGSVADLKQLKLDDYQLSLDQQGQSALKVSGSGTFDSETQDADFQIAMQTFLARLLASPGASPTDGALDFKGRVTNKQKKVTLAGKLVLTPTGRAKNELQLDGSADISKADSITGNVKLAAESLDVTRYYDLLSGNKTGATNTPSAATAAAPSPDPNKEPDAIKLPLKNFTFTLNIGHLFLREVDIANWQTTALLDGGHVVVKPCQLTLNNAPIKATADLDLGVPGYKYDVTFTASAIPLAPLVNSFVPDRKGQLAGVTSADAQVKGAGITGAGLQKNLTGQFNFATTNMNLSIANVRSPLINSVINVIVGIPDLIRNPAAAIGSLLGRLTGSAKSKGGWADELTAAPIDVISMNAKAGDGRVQLQQAEVRSKAFQALAAGDVILAPILTNSAIQIPVTVALARAMADKIGLVNADTPTNAVYVALPEFLKMQGTVGNPKASIDKLVLVALAAKTGGGVVKQIGEAGGEKAGSLINAVGGLFGGGKSAAPAGPATNSPSKVTNSTPASKFLNLFK
jgi:AsmA family